MDYGEVLKAYSDLKELTLQKKQAIIKKQSEELNKIDEETIVLCEKISKFDLKNNTNLFSEEQKQELKKLGEEIKVIQENNEILIKHSLGVINNILSGILNVVQSEKNSYNAKGMGCTDNESLDISSITEEA